MKKKKDKYKIRSKDILKDDIVPPMIRGYYDKDIISTDHMEEAMRYGKWSLSEEDRLRGEVQDVIKEVINNLKPFGDNPTVKIDALKYIVNVVGTRLGLAGDVADLFAVVDNKKTGVIDIREREKARKGMVDMIRSMYEKAEGKVSENIFLRRPKEVKKKELEGSKIDITDKEVKIK